MTPPITIELDAFPTEPELDALWRAAWGAPLQAGYAGSVLPRSLCHAVARRREGGGLAGFVNVATDGGAHAFLLDTTVHPEFRRRGIATALVRCVTEAARARGAEWLHVDCEAHLAGFYAGCGFRPTAAGLIRLAPAD